MKLPINKFKNIDLFDLKLGLDLLFNINFGSTSEFRSELTLKGLISNMGYSIDFYEEYVVITITLNSNYEDMVIKAVEEKLNNLEINEKDITRKRNATIATLILNYEDIENVNLKIQDDIINEGHIVTDLKERIYHVDASILKEIMKYFSPDNASISVFKPKENQEG